LLPKEEVDYMTHFDKKEQSYKIIFFTFFYIVMSYIWINTPYLNKALIYGFIFMCGLKIYSIAKECIIKVKNDYKISKIKKED